MTDRLVIIAGGGIGGLATALTLHQIGVPCVVFEAVREMRPLGVGINMQPNAVRELYDLGFTEEELDRVGVPAREWALVGLNGNDIYSEPRGLDAGYNWPQYAVHRGLFHVALHDKVVERIGPEAVRLGSRVTGYARSPDGGVTAFVEHADGATSEATGTLLIGADGIHSAVRAQMHPAQPPIHWGGAVMWRGTTRARPIRTGSSFVGLGTHRHRIVFYPISHPAPETGLATINWIAEVTQDNSAGWQQSGWFRQVDTDSFAHHFEDWFWDWLDVPALIGQADTVFENPMIDRDPVPTWQDGPVALLGDAAHAMYPTGSNGGSQAIVDARVLGAAMVEHGATPEALAAYDARLCGPISEVILRNRGAGPFGLLNMVDERCGGTFDNIDDVIPPAERAEFMAGYRAAAGFARETLNQAPPTIPQGHAPVPAQAGETICTEVAMTTAKTYTGGCHCGQVRYEATTDPSQAIACNCSKCASHGLWLTFVTPEGFKLQSGEDALADYQFNKHVIHHVFCRTCGVESFARGRTPDGKDMIAINVRCLDGVDIATLSPKPFDGRSR